MASRFSYTHNFMENINNAQDLALLHKSYPKFGCRDEKSVTAMSRRKKLHQVDVSVNEIIN